MTFVDEIIKDKPSKYETILKSRILSKKLKLKITEYDTIQSQYDKLIQQETVNRKPASGGNESLKGKLKQLSAAGKDWLWGVNSGGGIYTCKKPCDDSTWIKIPGGLTQIEGGDKEVWGVNSTNRIWKMNQDHSNNWRHIPGKLDNISQGGDWVWGVKQSSICDSPVRFGDKIIIAQTDNEINTSNCGWYGCRVASMNESGPGGSTMEFKHGSSKTIFYLRPKVGGPQKNGDVIKYGDQVAISANNWPANIYRGKVHGCGWYGCRTAYVSGDLTMKFTHGKNDPKLFYIRPKIGSEQQTGDVFKFNDSFVLAYTGCDKKNCNPCGWYGCRVGHMGGRRGPDGSSYLIFGHGGSDPASFIIRPQPNTLKCSDIYKCKKPCDGNWILVNNPPGIIMKQLSCSNDYVYGLDTNKRAWRKNIDGSGEWSKFGNPWSWQFLHINASSSNGKILAVNMSRVIVETDKNGTAKWKRSASAGGASGLNTVSGDSQNEDFYFTNTNDQIYRNSPITSGGYWTDIKNENYGFEMVDFKQSNSDWKYLGQSNNITDCKIKAVEDKKNEYSSIVYTTGTSGSNGAYNKSCYGGIKGGNTNPTYVKGITTSLAPNGTSRLGGSEGTKLLKRMKNIHNDIEDLVKEQNKDTVGIKKVSNVIRKEKDDRSKELEQLLEKLQKDRIRINKLLNEPSAMAGAEDANDRQSSSYIIMLLWILVVIISIVLAGHLYTTDSENISPITYIFVGVWTIIFCTYYYRKFTQYGNTVWDSLSDALTSDTP